MLILSLPVGLPLFKVGCSAPKVPVTQSWLYGYGFRVPGKSLLCTGFMKTSSHQPDSLIILLLLRMLQKDKY